MPHKIFAIAIIAALTACGSHTSTSVSVFRGTWLPAATNIEPASNVNGCTDITALSGMLGVWSFDTHRCYFFDARAKHPNATIIVTANPAYQTVYNRQGFDAGLRIFMVGDGCIGNSIKNRDGSQVNCLARITGATPTHEMDPTYLLIDPYGEAAGYTWGAK
ncbi:MAG: hypothetical protein ACYC8W_07825 [Candidatus Tyrphobacter sp.]